MSNIIYDSPIAIQVTYNNLPEQYKSILSLDNIETILEMKFLSDDNDIYQMVRMCEKMGLDVTKEIVQAVIKAEEVYLKQIGVM